jgi:hypothetical protein
VLEQEALKQRSLVMVRLVRLGVALLEMGNFNGVMQVKKKKKKKKKEKKEKKKHKTQS